jgi:phosphopantothenoylcysteine synthetase/decarboxylase
LTPTAAAWLDHLDEVERLEALTGLPVRSAPRLPHEPKPHPMSDVLVGAPMTANSVAKLALGIADNQALTVLCDAWPPCR